MVREGLHKSTNQKTAVKIYEKFKLLEPNRRKSVKREIKIMERLDHKNIAKLFEAFDTQPTGALQDGGCSNRVITGYGPSSMLSVTRCHF